VLFSLVRARQLAPYFLGMAGPAYAVGAVAGVSGFWLAISFALNRLDDRVCCSSLDYLPAAWGMLIADRLW
jgi:hypothetical protein